MPLWKNGHFVEDLWQVVGDGEDIPADRPAIVPLQRWRAEREALAGRSAPLGLLIPPGARWSDITADLPRFPVIAVTIPKYGDGRAYSIVRLLRERDGYRGEIRAYGQFIIDQVPLMRRVGIDAIAVEDPTLKAQLERGLWPEVPEYLQPVDATREVPAGTRPWARRPAPAAGEG